MRIIRKWRLAKGGAEFGDKVRLDCCWIEPRRLLPRHKQCRRFLQLPDQTPTPMADLVACAEFRKLAQSATQVVRLPDINDFGVIDPIRYKALLRNRRITILEPTSATSVEEARV